MQVCTAAELAPVIANLTAANAETLTDFEAAVKAPPLAPIVRFSAVESFKKIVFSICPVVRLLLAIWMEQAASE